VVRDPAFDLAFVLNHLLLKGAWRPQWRQRYADAYAALSAAYLRTSGGNPARAAKRGRPRCCPTHACAHRREVAGRIPDGRQESDGAARSRGVCS
jgi:hypothetical protein